MRNKTSLADLVLEHDIDILGVKASLFILFTCLFVCLFVGRSVGRSDGRSVGRVGRSVGELVS